MPTCEKDPINQMCLPSEFACKGTNRERPHRSRFQGQLIDTHLRETGLPNSVLPEIIIRFRLSVL